MSSAGRLQLMNEVVGLIEDLADEPIPGIADGEHRGVEPRNHLAVLELGRGPRLEEHSLCYGQTGTAPRTAA
jgi:hypothetical protein